MKKLLATVLALVLALSCFVGMSAMAEDDLVKVRVSLQLHSEDRYEEGVTYWQNVATQYGLELDFITFNGDIAAEKTNALLASDDIPEIFYVNANVANLYGPEGKFTPVDELLEYMPNLAALIEAESVNCRRCEDGNLYYVPKYAPLYSTTEGNMTYRKDILEALGEEEPTTLDGWYDLYKEVQAAYPDMIVLMERSANVDGQMAPVFGMGLIASNCGILAQGDDREIVFLPTTENWKAMLEWYNKLFEEGILYEGYATVDYSLWWDQSICTDKCFACNTMNFSRASEATDTAAQSNFENVQWWVALMPENPFTNTNEILRNGSSWMEYGMAISSACENKEQVCSYLDWFFGDECMNDQIKFMNEEGKELALFYWPINFLNAYVTSEIPVMKDHFTKNSPLVKLTPVVSGTAEGAQRITDECEGLDTYVKKMRDEFIMGITSFDEWDAYVAQCEALGADVAVEVVQGYVDHYYASEAE